MSQKIKTSVEIDGSLSASQIANATTDTDKFLVSDGGVIKYRTGAEMASDLGVSAGTTSKVQHQVKAGVSIFKGQAVYVTGADGTNMVVGLASCLAESTSSKTMGLVNANVAANGFVDVVTEGLLSGLNTSSAEPGDPVWLGTNGNLRFGLSTKPSAPNHLVFIGIVTRVNANNGEIFVKVQNGFELDELHDVDLKSTAPINGHLLGYNGTLWVNKTIAGWLGYTPQAQLNGTGFVKASGTTITYDNTSYYPASNPNGYISTYTETDTLNSVTSRGSVTSNTIQLGKLGIGRAAGSNESISVENPEGSWLIQSFRNGVSIGGLHTNDGILNVQASTVKIQASTNATWNGDTLATRPWVTSQGYITGYTETDTLASVTSRGASTSSNVTLSGITRLGGGGYKTYIDGGLMFRDYGNNSLTNGRFYYQDDAWHFRGGGEGESDVTSDTAMYIRSGNIERLVLHDGNISSYAVPSSRTITINGTSYDLSANRSWTVTASETDTLATVTGRGASTSTLSTFDGGLNIGNAKLRWAANSSPTLGFPFTGGPNAFWIDVNDGDTGGIAIDNDGTTIYGAGDSGHVFRVIDEDVYQGTSNVDASTTFRIQQGQNGGGYVRGIFEVTDYLTAGNSARAPIFYDSNDTSYYGDFNSTTRQYQAISFGDSSRYSAINTTINGSGAGDKLILYGGVSNYDARLLVGADYDMLFKSQGNSAGKGSFKFYSGQNCNLAMTIDGSQYTSLTGGLSVAGNTSWFGGYGGGSGPGLAFENQNTFARIVFWGLDFYDWNNGTQMVINDGYVLANNSMRSPIFYDSNDTGYYLDPASTTTSLQIAGAVEQGNNLSRPLVQWGASGNATGAVVIKLPGTTSNYGMIHAVIDIYEYNSNNVCTVTIGGHNWSTQWHNYGAQVVGYTNKPVRLAVKDGRFCIVIGNGSSVWEYGQVVLRKIQNGTYYNNVMDLGGAYSIGIESDSYSWVSGDLRQLKSNSVQATDNMYSPIYYDANDSGYYFNPNTDASHRFQTPSGYIDIGPKNGGTCHIYTDRPSFYFNQTLLVNGNTVLHGGNYSSYAWPLEGGWKPASLASSTRLRGATSPDGGEFALAYSGGQIHPYADGFFYQNEGQYRVIDTNSVGSYAVLSRGQSNWAGSGVIDNVVGMLSWKNYGSSHVIFDASNGTTPSGTSCSNTNPQNNWSGSYPTLMGWNGSNTYGVRVDVSRYADSAGSAGSAGSATNATNSDNAGHLRTAYVGGQQLNPQTYFGMGVGLKAAMTATAGYWSDTLWINGYAGGDVLQMCAMHFQRNGTPRAYISVQASNATSYGTLYEMYSSYNMDAPNKSGTSYYQTNTWMQFNGSYGLYWPSNYGAHFHANDGSSYTQFRLQGSKNNWGGIYDSFSGVNGIMYDSAGNGGIYRETNGRWYLYHHVGNNCTAISTSTTSSSYRAYVGGSLYAEGDIVAYSDRRKKENIITVDNALDKVNKLRGVYYNRIDDDSKKRQVGVIAQEIQEVLPEVVTYAEDVDEYGVSYGNITGLLIEAIKEQQTQIEELKELVNKLINK
jgi:hypothetical protein